MIMERVTKDSFFAEVLYWKRTTSFWSKLGKVMTSMILSYFSLSSSLGPSGQRLSLGQIVQGLEAEALNIWMPLLVRARSLGLNVDCESMDISTQSILIILSLSSGSKLSLLSKMYCSIALLYDEFC